MYRRLILFVLTAAVGAGLAPSCAAKQKKSTTQPAVARPARPARPEMKDSAGPHHAPSLEAGTRSVVPRPEAQPKCDTPPCDKPSPLP